MMGQKKSTNMKAVVALLTGLAWTHTFGDAQTTYSVADCSDLKALPSITTDAVIDFTAATISCGTNTDTNVAGDITLELTSSFQELSLVNLRFSLTSGSSLVVSAPALHWQSEEIDEDKAGAALSVSEGCTAIFNEDVTFAGCTIVEYAYGEQGGAVSNNGELVFMGDAVFSGTLEGGALYNAGNVTFSGDATFEDNNNDNSFNYGGGGLFTEDGVITFKGAANFIGNEVHEFYGVYSEGVRYYGGKGGGLYVYVRSSDDVDVLFEGPVLFRGNTAKMGAGLYIYRGHVVFEDLVTFEDNVATSVGDASSGGGMAVIKGTAEFQAGVVATGNVAKEGGAFKIRDEIGVVDIQGPVTITGNRARYEGGAIWNGGNMTIPHDADISGNSAVFCPGIQNSGYWEMSNPESTRSLNYDDGSFEFSGGGVTYSGSSVDLCYWGEGVGNAPNSKETIDTPAANCDELFNEGVTLGGFPVLTWDTRVTSGIIFAVGSTNVFDIACTNLSIIFVTGGGELAVTSTADAFSFTNIRFEIGGYSDLYFNFPKLSMTGIHYSRIGGSTHVHEESSLTFGSDVEFIGNTLTYMSDSAWDERGGAALYNAGSVTFCRMAYFSGNGQFEQDDIYSWNPPGGAVLNVGSVEFLEKTKFLSNFNLRGGTGGGLANSGTVSFSHESVWNNNTAEYRNAEEGARIYGGHGAAFYNFGYDATAVFKSKATFMNNVGGFRGGAVGANGEDEDDHDEPVGVAITNKITFMQETTFTNNSFDVDRVDTGGAGLWVYLNATVDFQDKVEFRRNEAINGGAIINGGGLIKFPSAEHIKMIDNVGVESCPDVKNYDKDSYYAAYLFGDIDDASGVCGSSGDLCMYYEGEIIVGSDDPIVGESPDICMF